MGKRKELIEIEANRRSMGDNECANIARKLMDYTD